MKFAVLGTGMVGNSIGTKLIQLGHVVMMGSRSADNEKAAAWSVANGTTASHGTFADAAAFGEIIFNCTLGAASLEAMKMAEEKNLNGKILIDVSDPLDFSKGFPPSLVAKLTNTTSIAEEIQRAYPGALVVKTLNTCNCLLMVNPSLLPGDHDMFICSDHADAKERVMEILRSFGWKSIVDLGDLTASRGMEMVLPMWVRLYSVGQSPMFNFKIVR